MRRESGPGVGGYRSVLDPKRSASGRIGRFRADAGRMFSDIGRKLANFGRRWPASAASVEPGKFRTQLDGRLNSARLDLDLGETKLANDLARLQQNLDDTQPGSPNSARNRHDFDRSWTELCDIWRDSGHAWATPGGGKDIFSRTRVGQRSAMRRQGGSVQPRDLGAGPDCGAGAQFGGWGRSDTHLGHRDP